MGDERLEILQSLTSFILTPKHNISRAIRQFFKTGRISDTDRTAVPYATLILPMRSRKRMNAEPR